MNMIELYFEYLRNYAYPRLKATTIRGYVVNAEKYILPICGNDKLYTIDLEVIDEVVSYCRTCSLSNTSVIYVLNTFSSMLSYAVKRKYVKYNIINDYDFPRKLRYDYIILTMDDMNSLIDKAISLLSVISVPILLAAHYGLRRGEIAALKVSDIDFDNSVLHISKSKNYVFGEQVIDSPKNNHYRDILLSDFDLFIIKSYDSYRLPCKGDFLVRYFDGRPLSPNMYGKLLKSVLKSSNLPLIRFHDLRHSYATYMVNSGISPKIVSNVLGHSSVKFTLDTYVHSNLSEQKELLKLL